MNKLIGIGIVILLVLGAVYFVLNYQKEQPVVTDFDSCAAAGYPIMESYPRQCATPDGRSFTENVGNVVEKSEFIQVVSPQPGEAIASPVVIYGQARLWYFEASFPVYLEDANGKRIASGIATALDDWMTEEFVPFRAVLEWYGTPTPTGTLVFQKDNPSGLPENDDAMRMPVKLVDAAAAGLTPVKVYFQKIPKGDPFLDCSVVSEVTRYVPKTQGVGRAAIEALLGGPTTSEDAVGYTTTIPQHVELENLTISNGVATAEFSGRLEEGVGGSCRVTAIRSQIERTLKQFSTVQTVVISIDGRTEDILQP